MILTPDVHQLIRSRVESVNSQLQGSRFTREKGGDFPDQKAADDAIRERDYRKEELRKLHEVLEGCVVAEPGDDLQLAQVPCFVTIGFDCGDGSEKEERRILYEPPYASTDCSTITLNLKTPIGAAVRDQPVNSVVTVPVKTGTQTVRIKRAQKLREVEPTGT